MAIGGSGIDVMVVLEVGDGFVPFFLFAIGEAPVVVGAVTAVTGMFGLIQN